MTPMLIVSLLLFLGLVLIAIEVLVIPGVGFIGGLGVALLIGGGIMAHRQLPHFEATLAISGSLIASLMMFWLLPKTKFAQSMILTTRIEEKATNSSLEKLLGQTGVTTSPLRPSGMAQIDGMPIDVISDGEYIESNTRVTVALVEGNRVVVHPLGPHS